MRLGGLELGFPEVLLVFLVSAVALAAGVGASTSGADFSPFNPAWSGVSDLKGEAESGGMETLVVTNVSGYRRVSPSETVSLVLSPVENYSAEEVLRLKGFVERGGVLVVAGEFGDRSNSLLRGLGAGSRVGEGVLRDERFFGPSPFMPVAEPVLESNLTAGVGDLVLNYGSPVETNGSVVFETSEFAYLDRDGDGDLGGDEEMGRYDVAAVEALGRGRVLVLGDGSVFINAMQGREGNSRFAGNLLEDREVFVLDLSHGEGLPPLTAAVLFLRRNGLAAAGLGVFFLVALRLGFRWPWGRERWEVELGREEVVEFLASEHPEWDRERVERMAKSLGEREESPLDGS